MQKFWTNLASWLRDSAGLVAAIAVVLTIVLGFGMTKLTFATGQDSYLNPEDQVYIDNVRYQELFGGQAMLILMTAEDGTTVNDMMSPANLAEMERIAEELRAHPDLVTAVVTPGTALGWSADLVSSPEGPTGSVAGKALVAAVDRAPTQENKDARLADAAVTLGRIGEVPAEDQTLDNPAWVDFLIHDNEGGIRKALGAFILDDTHAQIVVRLAGNASIEVEGAGADLVVDTFEKAKFENTSLVVTGAPVLLGDINDYLRGGMMSLGGIAVVVMAVILLVLFTVRWRLLPLAVVLLGVLWAFGLAGYLGIQLSLVTIAGLPVMLGVGIDYAIQMHARVEEEVALGHTDPIQETARNLCPALLVVTFDAIFAFAALRFAQVPMIRDFGLLLAIGIAVICLCSIVAPLAALGIREKKSPTPVKGEFDEGPLGRFVVKLGSLPPKLGPALAIASLVVFVGGLAVEGELVLQTDPVEWVDQSSKSIKDYRTLQSETGSSSELGVFVESEDVFGEETIRFIDDFAAQQLEAYPDDLLTAVSLITTVDYLLEVPGGGDVYPRPEDVKAAYDVAPHDIQISTVNPDAGANNLIFRYGNGSLEDRKVLLEEMQATMAEMSHPGVTATPSGLAVVGVGLLENLEANRILLTYLAILFVGAFLAVRLRSLVRSLLSLVPVLIAVGLASIVAFVFSLKLSPMTAVGGPLVVAACTEFTSLILLRFIEERGRGLEPQQAVDVAAARTGRAFIVSGLTAISGVAVIATSSLPLLRDFGILVAMNVAVALLSALVILPPLLIWADKRNWVSKGMLHEHSDGSGLTSGGGGAASAGVTA